MEVLIEALSHFETKDHELQVLVNKTLARLKDDVEESGLVYSSVMEELMEELEEYLSENYLEDVEDEDDDTDEEELRDVDDED